mmetsp:Transcript_9439/g.13154  ORF Transcript_9439/g.13154 Transcript_9439/m.13154 type:complete len:202 (-) Transcript_9439:79-684(-)
MGDFQAVYCWIDEIPLSRPKKNISRDFSDAVLFSEVLHHFYPSKVDLHNYISTNSVSKKEYNWNTLNRKVLRKVVGYEIPPNEVKDLVACKKGAIEKALQFLKTKIESKKKAEGKKTSRSKKVSADSKRSRPVRGIPTSVQGQQPAFGDARSLLDEKDSIIEDLRETVAILQTKIQKLEQLLRLKDKKIEQLQAPTGGSRR